MAGSTLDPAKIQPCSVDRVAIPLKSIPSELVSVVIDTDIKLPPRMAVSGRSRFVMKRKLESKLCQIAPARKYRLEEEESSLC